MVPFTDPMEQPMIEQEQDVASKATALYNERPKRYNCAQTIAAALGRDELIESLKSCGGGKAPGGLCGALYAATLIAEENSDAIKMQFQQMIGNTECKLIRQSGKATCNDCVRCAAGLTVRKPNA